MVCKIAKREGRPAPVYLFDFLRYSFSKLIGQLLSTWRGNSTWEKLRDEINKEKPRHHYIVEREREGPANGGRPARGPAHVVLLLILMKNTGNKTQEGHHSIAIEEENRMVPIL